MVYGKLQVVRGDINRLLTLSLVFVFNFHPVNAIPEYEFFVNNPGKYRIILNTDNAEFGGLARIDETIDYFSTYDSGRNINLLKIYNTNRTAIVLKRID